MTTETQSLMDNSSGPRSLDVRVGIRRLQPNTASISSRPTVNRKLQMLPVKVWTENH